MTIEEARAVMMDLYGIVFVDPVSMPAAEKKKRLETMAKVKLAPSDKIPDGQLLQHTDEAAGKLEVSHGRYNAFIAAWNFLMKANLGKTNFPVELPMIALATQAKILADRKPPAAVAIPAPKKPGAPKKPAPATHHDFPWKWVAGGALALGIIVAASR